MVEPRTLLAVWLARAAAGASRSLGRGGGTAISGVLGLGLQPRLSQVLAAQLGLGSVMITGTNGKTTTSMLVAAAARANAIEVVANPSGSNMARGIAASLALAARLDGSLPDSSNRLGVFEVDEAHVPLLLSQLKPRVAVFLNLFRDQLDRYGEVDAVAGLWRQSLVSATTTRLALNADDPAIAALARDREDAVYFGVDDASLDCGVPDHASDFLSCPVCGGRLNYSAVYLGHQGHWRCDACGRQRPEPGFKARNIRLGDGRGLSFELHTPAGVRKITMPLGGLYNVYNALAAAACAATLGLPDAATDEALSGASAAFGRQESFALEGRTVELFLAKNPAGLNQVLATLRLDPSRKTLLLILNDGIADGRDISWIWDAGFEESGGFEKVIVAGRRAYDMALRLKYAEWPEDRIEVVPDIGAALIASLSHTRPGETLSVVPTYTAMLRVRGLLAQKTGKAEFWRS